MKVSLRISALLAFLLGSAVRICSAEQPFWVEEVARGLNYPWSIVWLPDGDALVTERQGGIRRIHDGKLEAKPLENVPNGYHGGLQLGGGPLDIVLDPEFATNRTIYFSSAEGTADGHYGVVYRARLAASELTDVKRIFTSKGVSDGFAAVAGRMMLMPDGTLLVSLPDDEDHRHLAQRLNSDIGKVARINRDGSIPTDNPFLKTPDALPEIWSYGNRVPLGFYYDQQTRRVWEVEPGPRGGDELNILKPGGNYGWGAASWGFDYGGGLAADRQFGPGLEEPVLVWTPSHSPSGITRYRGRTYPEWDGNFFVGQLTTKELVRLKIDDRRVVLQEDLLTDLDERIRDVVVAPDDHIYVLTDNSNGRILRIQPGRPKAGQLSTVAQKIAPVSHVEPLGPNIAAGDPARGRAQFVEHCAACHSVGSDIKGGRIGPDLVNAYQRKAGISLGYDYSPAMAGAQIVWNQNSLIMFLGDPQGYVPGTKMAAPPLADLEARKDIAGYIKQQSGTAGGAPSPRDRGSTDAGDKAENK